MGEQGTGPGGACDSLDRTKLKELFQLRVADGSLLRLIGKLLRVGVLDGAEYSAPDLGTAQGSALSPLLGNVYLHYVHSGEVGGVAERSWVFLVHPDGSAEPEFGRWALDVPLRGGACRCED